MHTQVYVFSPASESSENLVLYLISTSYRYIHVSFICIILGFLRFGNCGFDYTPHNTRKQRVQLNRMSVSVLLRAEYRNIRFPGFLCLLCYMQAQRELLKKIKKVFDPRRFLSIHPLLIVVSYCSTFFLTKSRFILSIKLYIFLINLDLANEQAGHLM